MQPQWPHRQQFPTSQFDLILLVQSHLVGHTRWSPLLFGSDADSEGLRPGPFGPQAPGAPSGGSAWNADERGRGGLGAWTELETRGWVGETVAAWSWRTVVKSLTITVLNSVEHSIWTWATQGHTDFHLGESQQPGVQHASITEDLSFILPLNRFCEPARLPVRPLDNLAPERRFVPRARGADTPALAVGVEWPERSHQLYI